MNEQGITDLSFLKIYASNNPTLMKNFIQSFLDKTPSAIQQIEEHYASGDFHALSRSAHSLKPQLSYMGIQSVNNLIIEIEESAKNQTDTQKISSMLTTLKEILESAYAELRVKSSEL